jgi:hypothetical protein
MLHLTNLYNLYSATGETSYALYLELWQILYYLTIRVYIAFLCRAESIDDTQWLALNGLTVKISNAGSYTEVSKNPAPFQDTETREWCCPVYKFIDDSSVNWSGKQEAGMKNGAYSQYCA